MTDLIKQLEAKRDDLRTVNILLSKLIGRAIDRIRELEAQIETLSIESATSRLAENRERERAEKAEAEQDEAAKMADELWQAREAIRNERDAIEAATIERCAQVCDPVESSYPPSWTAEVIERHNAALRWCAVAIRALKPSGQSEKPVNPYLLGGSSTQSEG